MPEVTSETEEGFADLVFAVESGGFTPEGEFCVEAVGLHQGSELGFAVTIGSTWRAQDAAEGFTVHWGSVCLSSRGERSDRLVGLLDSLYETGCGARRMHDTGPLTAVLLGDDPGTIATSAVKMKLYFRENESEERYGELYLNLDFPSRRVELREKDGEYRHAVVMALSNDAV